MKIQNTYDYIFFAGLVIWLIETAYFGFNKTPGSGLEATLDAFSALLMVYGFLCSLVRNMKAEITINVRGAKDVEINRDHLD